MFPNFAKHFIFFRLWFIFQKCSNTNVCLQKLLPIQLKTGNMFFEHVLHNIGKQSDTDVPDGARNCLELLASIWWFFVLAPDNNYRTFLPMIVSRFSSTLRICCSAHSSGLYILSEQSRKRWSSACISIHLYPCVLFWFHVISSCFDGLSVLLWREWLGHQLLIVLTVFFLPVTFQFLPQSRRGKKENKRGNQG